MSAVALITEGIGPAGKIKYVMTLGFDLGAAVPVTPPSPPPTPPPPAPVVQTIFPHDDYDDEYRPWWNRPRGDSERRELRLRRMREEIGLISPAEEISSELPPAAEKEVAKAVEAIIAEPEVMRSEVKTFDLVKSFEDHFLSEYRKVLLTALARDARLAQELSAKKQRELAEFAWREEVRIKLSEKMEQVLAEHARRDEEEEYLIGFWLM